MTKAEAFQKYGSKPIFEIIGPNGTPHVSIFIDGTCTHSGVNLINAQVTSRFKDLLSDLTGEHEGQPPPTIEPTQEPEPGVH